MKSPWSERETERERKRGREKQEKCLKSLVKEIKMLSQVIIEADDDTNCSYYRIESEKEQEIRYEAEKSRHWEKSCGRNELKFGGNKAYRVYFKWSASRRVKVRR